MLERANGRCPSSRHGLTSRQLFTGGGGQETTCLRRPYSFPRLSRRVLSRLAPATGDSVFGLDLDRPARVAEVAPHFVAHSSTKFVR
jgi:hypothetical protein